MRIAIGADHAGFRLKERIRQTLLEQGHDVTDFGATSPEPTDYPDFAIPVARSVAAGQADRGVLVCSTGIGMSIAANKVPGVRAALGTNREEVGLIRSHNDANVLTLGAKFIAEEEALRLLAVFLTTEFEGGRHARRLGKIADMEKNSDHHAAASTKR
jgi:ribose 5-phosphate isomerase B